MTSWTKLSSHSAMRRFVMAATAVIIPMGLIVAAGSAPAEASGPPKAVGIANCPIYSGSGTVSPGLTPAGSPGGVKINFTASMTLPGAGCGNSNITKPANVVIIGGTVTGSGFYKALSPCSASSCADFDGTAVVGKIVVTVAWLTSPPNAIANTTIVYKNNPATVSGAPTDMITLQAPPGTAHKTGSFVAPPTNNTTQIKTSLPGPACGPGPFTNFTISGGDILV
jgi:hypothetical protein